MEIKINLNETVKVKLTDYGKDVYYHQFDDLNKRIIKNGGKPIEPHFPKEDENGYCEMQLWGLMELYGNYMSMEHQNVFKPFQIIYEYNVPKNLLEQEVEKMTERERLIELLDIIIQPGQKTLGDIADYLLVNGVIISCSEKEKGDVQE